MAVIKSGDSTDQLHVDSHLAAYVTLRDSSGVTITPLSAGGAVTISNFPATQAVSVASAVSVNQGTPAAVTGAWPVVLTNTAGTNQVRVTTAGNLGVDLASSVVPNSALPAQTAWVGGSDGTKLQGLLVDGTGALKVNNSANTQPVSIAAPVAVTGTFFQPTQPVSASALPLPAGAATDANLTARLPIAANGALQVTTVDGFKATYVAGTAGFAPAATATDVVTITGSASKTVRITKVYLSFTATTAVSVPVSLIRRSAANTGGTSVTFAATPRDTNNPAATAVVAVYTANPTALGTAVGSVLEAGKIPAPLTGGAVQVTVFEFGTVSNQAIVLRGTAQALAVNLNSTTVAGGSMAVAIQWTEE